MGIVVFLPVVPTAAAAGEDTTPPGDTQKIACDGLATLLGDPDTEALDRLVARYLAAIA